MLFLFFVLGLASAQTCSDAGEGPCLNGACPTGTTCTNSATICCENTMIATTTTPAAATVAGCTDSTTANCGSLTAYCSVAAYYTLMTTYCPATCGRCGVTVAATTTTTASSSSCVDLLNPSTGVSDCPSMASYCNNSVYYTVMTQQCPKTCARCSSG